MRSFFGEEEPQGREVPWIKSSEGKRQTLEVSPGKKVEVEKLPAVLSIHQRVTSGDLAVEAGTGWGGWKVRSLDNRIAISDNLSLFRDAPDPEFTFRFPSAEEITVHVGSPHCGYREGKRVFRTFRAWKDSHVDRGIEWITSLEKEDLPWPETGIAIGFCLVADVSTIHANRRRYPFDI